MQDPNMGKKHNQFTWAFSKPKRQEPVCSHEMIKDAPIVPKTKLYMNLNKQNAPPKTCHMKKVFYSVEPIFTFFLNLHHIMNQDNSINSISTNLRRTHSHQHQ
jgi:hypothetical protein